MTTRSLQRQTDITDALDPSAAQPFLPRAASMKGSGWLLDARQLAGPHGPASSIRRGARKYSDEFERRVCEAYAAGANAGEIARKFRIPPSSVGTIVRRAGIQRTHADTIRQQIIEAWHPDLSHADIARRLRTSRSYVSIVLGECGLSRSVTR